MACASSTTPWAIISVFFQNTSLDFVTNSKLSGVLNLKSKIVMDERADRERTAKDISPELKLKMAEAVKKVTEEIKRRKQLSNSPILVAIDGGTGAGKSTLAILVAAEVHGVIVQGDDFCQTEVDWNQMNAAEKAINCIDWKRARLEALKPLLAGQVGIWHPFNFTTGIGLAGYTVTRQPAPVIILDGAYSSNPQLADIINLTVLVDTPAKIRYARHNEREGHDDFEWHKTWNEAEEYYFTHVRPPASFDLVISINPNKNE
jgi:uridine kinase